MQDTDRKKNAEEISSLCTIIAINLIAGRLLSSSACFLFRLIAVKLVIIKSHKVKL
jgi:hypothetical protein